MDGQMKRRAFMAGVAAAPFAISGAAAAEGADGRRIRVGQIGLAHPHAPGKLDAIRALPELFELVGVAEDDPKMRARLGNTDGIRWMSRDQLLDVPGLEALAIETTVPDLISNAGMAVSRGLHIHLDKPAGTDYQSFLDVVGKARRDRLVIQMGYMLRYNPAFEFLFRAHENGWFGEIIEIDAMMGKKADAGLRNELAQFHGGGFFELACHILDTALFLMGTPDDVSGFHLRTGEDTGDAFADNQLAVLKYPNALVSLRCNHNDPFGFARRRFNLIGSMGGMEIHPLESGRFTLYLDRPRGDFEKGIHEVALPDAGRSYRAEFRDLARAIRDGSGLRWNYDHDLLVQKTLLRICNMPE